LNASHRSRFLLCVLMGLFCHTPLEGAGARKQRSSAEKDKFVTFSFADSLNGWGVGGVKTGGLAKDSLKKRNVFKTMVLQTKNGGMNWDLQSVVQSGEEGAEVRAMYALDSRHCWIVMSQTFNDKDFILTTSDGTTWKVLNFPYPEIIPKKIFFQNEKNGWLIGGEVFDTDKLYRTADGGKTWQPYGIGFDGTFHDIQFTGKTGYIVANLKATPSVATVLRSNDDGNIWIVANEIKPDTGFTIRGQSLRISKNDVFVLVRKADEHVECSYLINSKDGFVSFTMSKINYEKETKSAETLVADISISGSAFFCFDPISAEGDQNLSVSNLITSSDFGKTWNKVAEVKTHAYNLQSTRSDELVYSTGQGEILFSTHHGSDWFPADINFRNIFLKPTGDILAMNLEASPFDESEDITKDSVYSSKWESTEDSILALNLTRNVNATKYKPDAAVDFSVGIDSIYSSTIVFHKRARYGAKHQTWDLIKEESRVGEIRIRKYKTLALVGNVRSVNGRKPLKYSWSSSINGELSDRLSFTTSPKQLFAGTHYIFFKAMDDQGRWSSPVVVKVVVEDFPKYRFPFEGVWIAGGNGSYYNTGHHIRGIKYAIDLNYEGQDGGDSDFGLPVRASTDGVVSFAGYAWGYGRMVKIDYMFGGHKYTTLTGHLSTICVAVGEKVKQGQEIGACGSTGRSSAPHIHWELRVDDQCTPPEPIFENDSTVIQTIHSGQSFSSDNKFQPDNIIDVSEGEIANTEHSYKGYHHSYCWTYVTKSKKTAEAVWRPALTRSGVYKIQVHIPKKFAEAQAKYQIHSRAGVQEIKVIQSKYTDEWVDLGTYAFEAGDDMYVSLDNATGQSRGTVAFDDVRFIGLWEAKQNTATSTK
jgi:murein DD-endopeptidase MepM/ murein hydrolase activator NlpD